jgi:serine/threonine protein kinase
VTEKHVGPWLLGAQLGSGGNADVWRARNAAGREVALKVVHSVKAHSEPYRRFAREIQFLLELGDSDGVLELVDAHLPDRPNSGDPAWLAMPIATPISDALRDAPLETVVHAMATVSGTLARLHDEHGVAHRDIKPGNLYERDGNWLVGDFGLVSIPDVEELTRSGRPLGPAHYTPYEMLLDPAAADPKPADVYSLAKTLWVLATGQTFPPEGHQPAATRGFSIADFRSHQRAALLDQLIDRATRIHPEERPKMSGVAADLAAWNMLPEPQVAIDIGSARTRLREQIAQELEAEDLADDRKGLALAAIRRMSELFKPLNQALRDLHPRAEIDSMPDELVRNAVRTLAYMGSREIAFRDQRLSTVSRGDASAPYVLRLARTVELTEDGALLVWLFIDVGFLQLLGSDFTWRPRPWEAPVDSVQVERLLIEAVQEAAEQLVKAAGVFAEGPGVA